MAWGMVAGRNEDAGGAIVGSLLQDNDELLSLSLQGCAVAGVVLDPGGTGGERGGVADLAQWQWRGRWSLGGLSALADGLALNHKLMHLNLENNCIGARGLVAICEAIRPLDVIFYLAVVPRDTDGLCVVFEHTLPRLAALRRVRRGRRAGAPPAAST